MGTKWGIVLHFEVDTGPGKVLPHSVKREQLDLSRLRGLVFSSRSLGLCPKHVAHEPHVYANCKHGRSAPEAEGTLRVDGYIYRNMSARTLDPAVYEYPEPQSSVRICRFVSCISHATTAGCLLHWEWYTNLIRITSKNLRLELLDSTFVFSTRSSHTRSESRIKATR